MQQLCIVVHAFFQDKQTKSFWSHQINSVDRTVLALLADKID
jgi:hypothetical protein